jgi:asparagine synthetase B (glutamine-hydrolysing)
MCGIIGGVIKANNGFFLSETKIIDELLYMDALRGDDSTGLAIFSKDGELQILKDCYEAAVFRYSSEYQVALLKLIKDGKAVIGHNRKKTMGAADAASAHPFVINDQDLKPRFSFVHNGTLVNHTSLSSGLASNLEEIDVYTHTPPETEVDSEVLGTMLCLAEGDKTKLECMLGKVYGAYACVWIDQEFEKLYMLRNHERPLFIAETNMGVFWASEPAFLHAACSRNRLKIDKCYQIDTDTLYTINLSDSFAAISMEKLSPKKVMAPTKAPTPTTLENTSVKARGRMSKSAYKKFSKRYTGTKSGFYVNDYVTRHPGENGYFAGWHIWGTTDDDLMARAILPPMSAHEVRCVWEGAYVSGMIDSMYYDETTGRPVLLLNNIVVDSYETCH